MRYSTTEHFDREFRKLPKSVQAAFKKQLALLLDNMRHPSLRAKKYDESLDVWQGRVTRNVRFYFRIYGDVYVLLNIRKHKD
jgi:mRNA-degrading endonuclease RelE of RelBE toxin-antitoxin system